MILLGSGQGIELGRWLLRRNDWSGPLVELVAPEHGEPLPDHIAAAIDAFALTNRVNRTAITQKPFEFQYYTSLSSNNNITPSLGFTYRF